MESSTTTPTPAFVGASWAALLVGGSAFLVGLWNSHMSLGEKGYYLTVLLFGLFAAVSLQKSVRDRSEDIAVTGLYLGLCWTGVAAALTLMTVGLWNAGMSASERASTRCPSCSACCGRDGAEKNVRDLARGDRHDEDLDVHGALGMSPAPAGCGAGPAPVSDPAALARVQHRAGAGDGLGLGEVEQGEPGPVTGLAGRRHARRDEPGHQRRGEGRAAPAGHALEGDRAPAAAPASRIRTLRAGRR